jgi:putative inorganic carbon (HCO3(-)) transporter
MDTLYTLSPKAMWRQFKKESFAFWMICGYLFMQYVEPQTIFKSLAILPWDKVFVGLAALSLAADPQRRWVKNAANIWMTMFLIVILLSSEFATFPAISWSHWFDFFGWYVIYFLIINTVTTPERFFIFLAIFLVATFKMSLFGARTWALRGFSFQGWGIQGPAGFFENSGEFSIQMLMFAPIAYELAGFLKPKISRAAYWFLMLFPVTAAMSVLGASSRGSQVALVGQVGHAAYQRKLKLKTLIALALVIWGGYVMLPDKEKARFSTAGDDVTSVQRLDYWKAGIQMIEEHPVLGIGFFNFPAVFKIEHPHELFEGHAQLPHNIFIQVGTDAGLLGLGVFLALIYRNLKTARDIQRACQASKDAPAFAASVARGLTTATLGFVIAGQFVTVAYYPFLWINLALTVSLANVVARATASAPARTRMRTLPTMGGHAKLRTDLKEHPGAAARGNGG